MDAATDSRRFWRTRNGVLLAAAMLSSALAWWLIAWPVARLANMPSHEGHFALLFVHMIGGTAMLGLGGLNLYLAARRNRPALHRQVGRAYLGMGGIGAVAAIAVTLSSAHKSGPLLTNASLSLAMLGSAWLGCAALGWRAARNRRFESHAEWMLRSTILAWSFVFCRVASRVPEIAGLGGGEAFIWLSWVAPLLIGEAVIQWPKGARRG